jgi:hypothetical protein
MIYSYVYIINNFSGTVVLFSVGYVLEVGWGSWEWRGRKRTPAKDGQILMSKWHKKIFPPPFFK